MKLIDGKEVSKSIKESIKEEVASFKEKGLRAPHLATILVGHDGGSETYVGHKIRTCEELGFKSTHIQFEDDVTEKELLDKVAELNQRDDLDGFIVQLPLPKHIAEQRVIEAINPDKDVDGFHPINSGKMMTGLDCFLPATPAGIMDLLAYYDIDTEGKHCVVLGRSNIVGTPMGLLMSRKSKPGNATVTVVHSRSQNIKEICQSADIIIAAIGIPEYLKADMVKEGAVVVDVGTTRVKSDKTKSGWKLKGDVDFEAVSPKCAFITPVPGGVGPMTIVSLMKNTLISYKRTQLL